MYRVFVLILPLGLLFVAPPPSLAENVDFVPYQGFVSEALDDMMFLFEETEISNQERIDRLLVVWEQNFATSYIARFVLGRYARGEDKAVLERFQNVFAKVTAFSLSERVRDIRKPIYTFGQSKNLKNSMLITTRFRAEGGNQAIDINWRIIHRNERYLVVDIVIADISMLQSFRSEYTAYLRGNKGDIKALTQELERKFTTNTKENNGKD